MKASLMLGLCGLIVAGLMSPCRSAYAVAPFRTHFDNMYVKKEPASEAEKSLAAAATKAKCNVCHVGTSKKERNEYGKALSTLLTKKDGKDVAKITAALEKVAGMKSDPKDPKSPTFGELISQGKLPGGDPGDTATASADE